MCVQYTHNTLCMYGGYNRLWISCFELPVCCHFFVVVVVVVVLLVCYFCCSCCCLPVVVFFCCCYSCYMFTSSSPWGYFACPEGSVWPLAVAVLHCRIDHDRYQLLPGLHQAREGGEIERERMEGGKGGREEREGGRKGGRREGKGKGGRKGGGREGRRERTWNWKDSLITFTKVCLLPCFTNFIPLSVPSVDNANLPHCSSRKTPVQYHDGHLTCMHIRTSNQMNHISLEKVALMLYEVTHPAGCQYQEWRKGKKSTSVLIWYNSWFHPAKC